MIDFVHVQGTLELIRVEIPKNAEYIISERFQLKERE